MQNITDDITSQFAQLQNKNDMAEILKELFDKNKIYMISDLSTDEIKLLTRIYMLGKLKKYPLYLQCISFFVSLKLSNKRKSRKEIIEAFGGYMRQGGFMHNLNPMNWGKRQ